MPGRRRSRRRVRVCVVDVMVSLRLVEVVRPADILVVLGQRGGGLGICVGGIGQPVLV